MIIILIIFCAATCYESDAVRSQPFIGLSAMLNAFIAVCTATATLIYIEYPFLHMILIMPFLIISIGVDNVFLILKSWRLAVDEYPDRLTKAVDSDRVFVCAVTEVSVSLFITSLTDGLSFLVGSFSDFFAVRKFLSLSSSPDVLRLGVFCTYCALAILYMFLFQITLLNGLMIFHCRREINGRHCLLFTRVSIDDENGSKLYTLFCGRRKRIMKNHKSDEHSEIWFQIAYLMQSRTLRILTLLFYIGYLCLSTHYLINLPLGIQI